MTDTATAWHEEPLPADHRSGFVILLGRPNVGKSTLLNAYLGEKIAIVSPKPQTTRNRLLGILTRQDAQIIFTDTPGLHKPKHKLSEFMVTQALDALLEGDLILWVIDINTPVGPTDRRIGQLLQQLKEPRPVIMALNKIDRITDAGQQRYRIAAYTALTPLIIAHPISALHGNGTKALLTAIIANLPRGPRLYPPEQLSDQQTRFIVAEIIREKLLLLLQNEVPHAVAVFVDEFKERQNGLVYISADILVERDSQKSIILGQSGNMIKRVGQSARKEIEQILDQKVYLDLWIKTRRHWRRNEQILRHIGYPPPSERKKKHLPQF